MFGGHLPASHVRQHGEQKAKASTVRKGRYQELTNIAITQNIGNTWLSESKKATGFAGANYGGTLTSMWMWSEDNKPCTITTSPPWHICRSKSRVRTATSPRSTF